MKALRAISLGIILVMLFSTFAACESNNNEGASDKKDEGTNESGYTSNIGETNVNPSTDTNNLQTENKDNENNNTEDIGNTDSKDNEGNSTEDIENTENKNTENNDKSTEDSGNTDDVDKGDNNTEDENDISAQDLAVKAYNEYIKDDMADPNMAEFMIYDAEENVIALKNGDPIGAYGSYAAAVEALIGEDVLSFYEIKETFLSGLFCCVMMDTYNYPLNTLPEPSAAIDSYKDGAYVANGNRYASLIPLENLEYDRVTIKNGSKNGNPNANFAYTFLAEMPVLGQMPKYAKGYSYVIVVEPVQSLTVNVPEDAKYLYVYHHTVSSGKYYFPDEVVFSQKVKPENFFKLATWNTGNFSNGGKNTTITDAQMPEKQKQ